MLPVSVQDCEVACEMAQPECTSFSYNPVLTQCFLKQGGGRATCNSLTTPCYEANQNLQVAPVKASPSLKQALCEEDTACCIALDALRLRAPAFCASKVALLPASLGLHGLPMLPIRGAALILHGRIVHCWWTCHPFHCLVCLNAVHGCRAGADILLRLMADLLQAARRICWGPRHLSIARGLRSLRAIFPNAIAFPLSSSRAWWRPLQLPCWLGQLAEPYKLGKGGTHDATAQACRAYLLHLHVCSRHILPWGHPSAQCQC